jgi:hypothetical protein
VRGENLVESAPCRVPSGLTTASPHTSALEGGDPRTVVIDDSRGDSGLPLDSEEVGNFSARCSSGGLGSPRGDPVCPGWFC